MLIGRRAALSTIEPITEDFKRALRRLRVPNDYEKNTILAIVLSALALIGVQIYFGIPQMEKQKQHPSSSRRRNAGNSRPAPRRSNPGSTPQTGAPPQAVPGATPEAPGLPGSAPGQIMTREAALAASPRVRIETPNVAGLIALKGEPDRRRLIKYR